MNKLVEGAPAMDNDGKIDLFCNSELIFKESNLKQEIPVFDLSVNADLTDGHSSQLFRPMETGDSGTIRFLYIPGMDSQGIFDCGEPLRDIPGKIPLIRRDRRSDKLNDARVQRLADDAAEILS